VQQVCVKFYMFNIVARKMYNIKRYIFVQALFYFHRSGNTWKAKISGSNLF